MTNKKKDEATALAIIPTGSVPVPYDYGDNSEKGFENTGQEDFLVPFLNLLQDTNDEVNPDDPKYIEGAKPGMFLNRATKDLYPNVILVPVITQHHFVEWKPDRGGFVATHGIRDDLVMAAKRANGGKLQGLVTKEGNELVDTFIIFALVLEGVDAKQASGYVVIPFTGTKIKHYKDITYQMRKLKGAPMFSNRVLLTSFNDKNDKGRFKNVKLEPAIKGDGKVSGSLKSLLAPDSAVLRQGEMLHDQVLKGMMKANFSAESAEADGETATEAFA